MEKNTVTLYAIMAAMLLIITGLGAQTPWQQTSAANVTLEYRVTDDSQSLEVKVTANTTGWVSAGFNPTTVMRNANIIIGYVSGTTASIRDDYGVSNTSHASDVGLGGTSDVTLIGGTESGGSTMLHFSIPLNSGDQYDRELQIGQSYPVILARGANNADNYSGMHADAGISTITLQAPVSSDDDLVPAGSSRILGSYPNPFNPQATIRYSRAQKGGAVLSIYNPRGQIVHEAELPSEAGEQSYVWQAAGLPSGIYTARLRAGDGLSWLRLNLVK